MTVYELNMTRWKTLFACILHPSGGNVACVAGREVGFPLERL